MNSDIYEILDSYNYKERQTWEPRGECMSKNTCRMMGLLTMLISVFFLIGGLFLGNAGLPAYVTPCCLAAGLILLAVGVVFFAVGFSLMMALDVALE